MRESLRLRRVQTVFRRLHVFEMFLDQVDKFLVVEIAGGADDKIAGGEMVSIKTGDHGTIESLNRVSRAENR